MKQFITKQQVATLERLRRRGKELVDELTALENDACALLGLNPLNKKHETDCDRVVDCVWNGETVERLLNDLGVVVR